MTGESLFLATASQPASAWVLLGPICTRRVAHRDFPVAEGLQKLSEVENVRAH